MILEVKVPVPGESITEVELGAWLVKTGDIVEMERMIQGYLEFARGEGDEAPVDTDLGQLLDEVVAGARRDGAEISVAAPAAIRPNAKWLHCGQLTVATSTMIQKRVSMASPVDI